LYYDCYCAYCRISIIPVCTLKKSIVRMEELRYYTSEIRDKKSGIIINATSKTNSIPYITFIITAHHNHLPSPLRHITIKSIIPIP
jgi:hypothetical protein